MRLLYLPCGNGGLDATDVTHQITIDDKKYDLRFRWSTQDGDSSDSESGSWTMSLGLASEEPLMTSKLTVGRPLLNKIKYMPDCPSGFMVISDTSGSEDRITYSGLGIDKRFRLLYFTNN